MSRVLFACLIVGSISVAGIAQADGIPASEFVEAAIALKDPNVKYDGRYRRLAYPLGDVPADTGVCSDVIVRAYRLVGVDLQKLVHEDMKANFGAYPSRWGLSSTDRNIDHRRVPNLRMFFTRHGTVLNDSADPNDYKPGDIVTWSLRKNGSLPHIGIVTDRYASDNKHPLIMHNIGGGQVIEDILFKYRITGHYRYGLE